VGGGGEVQSRFASGSGGGKRVTTAKTHESIATAALVMGKSNACPRDAWRKREH
jgi:hypothetical protein